MHQRLPAEWEPQSGVLLTWPHPGTDWAPVLSRVEPVFVRIGREVTRFERRLGACHDEDRRAHVAARLAEADVDLSRVVLAVVPSDDTWARDHGPITVYRGGRPAVLDYVFNGWGGKFEATLDDQIPSRLAGCGVFGHAACEVQDLVLEGGSIEVDGGGTLLTTRQCLLNPNRNPGLGQAEIEARLRTALGVTRFLWLSHGHLEGDDTDSHVDTLARLCDPRTIAYQSCDDRADPHHENLAAMAEELRAFRTAGGDPYRLLPLPWPRPCLAEDGRRLPATYANFLIVNDAVLVPTYDDPADRHALARLEDVFPDREIVGVPCRALVEQGGSLHCLTMQLPEGLLA